MNREPRFILVADTSGPYCVLALATTTGEVIGIVVFEAHRTLSVQFFPTIERLLIGCELRSADIGFLGVGVGPGSFTGLRVGLTSIKTLSQTLGIPLVAIRTLEAYRWPHRHQGFRKIVVMLPSRKDEVYIGTFCGETADDPCGMSFADADTVIAHLSQHDLLIVSSAPPVLDGREIVTPHAIVKWPAATALASLAANEISAGRFLDYNAISPAYVVPPTISVSKKTVFSIRSTFTKPVRS